MRKHRDYFKSSVPLSYVFILSFSPNCVKMIEKVYIMNKLKLIWNKIWETITKIEFLYIFKLSSILI